MAEKAAANSLAKTTFGSASEMSGLKHYPETEVVPTRPNRTANSGAKIENCPIDVKAESVAKGLHVELASLEGGEGVIRQERSSTVMPTVVGAGVEREEN